MKIREARREDVKHIAALNHKLNEYHLKFDDYYRLRPNLEDIVTRAHTHFDDMVTSEDCIGC